MKQNPKDSQWLDEIREEMQDFSAEIPADGWERVSSSLPSPTSNASGSKRWIGIAASVFLCAVLGGGYFLFYDEPESLPETTIDELKRVQASEHEVPIYQKENTATSISREPQLCIASNTLATATNYKPTEEAASQTLEETEQSASDLQATDTGAQTIETTPQTTEQVPHAESENPLPSLQQEEEAVLLAMNKASIKGDNEASWALGLHLGGHGSILDADMAASPSSMSDATSEDYQGTTSASQTDEVLDSNHHNSWSIGLSLAHQIMPRTTLETGIVFTRLSSDVKMSITGIQSQNIQYLGIPLRINYEILHADRYHLYTGGGIMLERALSANRGGNSIDVKPWQWSSNLSIGGECSISHNISLYIEPGINWYLNPDSSIPSLHSQSPLYFNLRGGIRIKY